MREWLKRWRARRARPTPVDLPFQEALDRAEVGMAHVAPDSRILHVNRRLPELLEYSGAELVSARFRELLHPEELSAYLAATDGLGDARSESFGIETRMVTKSGGIVPVRLTGSVIRNADGTPKLAIMIVEDLTARIRWEEELQKKAAELASSERELRTVIESMRDVILVMDSDGRYVRVPQTAAHLLFAPRSELIGRTLHEVLPPEIADRFLGFIHKALKTRDAVPMEYSLPISGRTVWFSGVVSPMSDHEVVWVARDVTAQKEAAEALRESEARYRLLFEANPMPMWLFDRATLRFLSVNEAAQRQYGYSREEFMQMTLLDIRPPEDAERLRYAVAERRDLERSVGWRHVRKDGTVIEVEIVAHTIRFGGHDAELVLAQDVTERKRMEAQLRQAQKMDAVGQLAGGIAHDFNNMLTAIVNYSDLVLEAATGNQSIQDDVLEIRRAADRAAALTRQLLAFSRQQVVRMEIVSINEVVSHMEKFLARIVREDVRFEVSLEEDPGLIEADPSQIEQVIMNLVVNARDAMPDGGTVGIRTTTEILDGKRFAVLTISDSGRGIPAALKDRIFEPFYTTKDPGSGTGLGLAIVHGIVQQAGGRIEVISQPGAGATFRVWLPIVNARKAVASEPVSEAAVPRGREVILLVEDDDAVRAVAVRILRKQGYSVLEARNGREGIEIFEQGCHDIQLLITDMVMPAMSGSEMAGRMRARAPHLPILFMSGYSKDAAAQLARLGISAYLEKPFTPAGLATTVRTLLDSANL